MALLALINLPIVIQLTSKFEAQCLLGVHVERPVSALYVTP